MAAKCLEFSQLVKKDKVSWCSHTEVLFCFHTAKLRLHLSSSCSVCLCSYLSLGWLTRKTLVWVSASRRRTYPECDFRDVLVQNLHNTHPLYTSQDFIFTHPYVSSFACLPFNYWYSFLPAQYKHNRSAKSMLSWSACWIVTPLSIFCYK